MNSISPYLNLMIKASEKASKILIRDFGEVEKLQVSLKGPNNFVTNADRKVEEILIEELEKSKKNFSILTEESGLILVFNSCCMTLLILITCSQSLVSLIMSKTVSPTDVERKFPPNVEPCIPASRTRDASSLARHAPIGTPLPSALATMTTSG